MWNLAQFVIGGGVILLGLLVNASRYNPKVKVFVERWILGRGDLFEENAPYAPAVNFAGWKSFVTGLGIAIPFPVVFDTLALIAGVAVVVWLSLQVRREYEKMKAGKGQSLG